VESGDGKISAEEVEQLNSLLVAQGTLKENLARIATKLDKVSHSKAAPDTVTPAKTEREREERDTPQRQLVLSHVQLRTLFRACVLLLSFSCSTKTMKETTGEQGTGS